MDDTRKSQRRVVSVKVRFKSSTLDDFIIEHCRDVSEGGVFLRSQEPLPVGTLLKFQLLLADDTAVIEGVGRVIWKREDEDPGMGIKFIKMDEGSQARLQEILEKATVLPNAGIAVNEPSESDKPESLLSEDEPPAGEADAAAAEDAAVAQDVEDAAAVEDADPVEAAEDADGEAPLFPEDEEKLAYDDEATRIRDVSELAAAMLSSGQTDGASASELSDTDELTTAEASVDADWFSGQTTDKGSSADLSTKRTIDDSIEEIDDSPAAEEELTHEPFVLDTDPTTVADTLEDSEDGDGAEASKPPVPPEPPKAIDEESDASIADAIGELVSGEVDTVSAGAAELSVTDGSISQVGEGEDDSADSTTVNEKRGLSDLPAKPSLQGAAPKESESKESESTEEGFRVSYLLAPLILAILLCVVIFSMDIFSTDEESQVPASSPPVETAAPSEEPEQPAPNAVSASEEVRTQLNPLGLTVDAAPDAEQIEVSDAEASTAVDANVSDAVAADDAEAAVIRYRLEVVPTPEGARVTVNGATKTGRAIFRFENAAPESVRVEAPGFDSVTRSLTLADFELQESEASLRLEVALERRQPAPRSTAARPARTANRPSAMDSSMMNVTAMRPAAMQSAMSSPPAMAPAAMAPAAMAPAAMRSAEVPPDNPF